MKALFYFADGRIAIEDVPQNPPQSWVLRDKMKTAALREKRKKVFLRGDVPVESKYEPYADAYFLKIRAPKDASFAIYEEQAKVRA